MEYEDVEFKFVYDVPQDDRVNPGDTVIISVTTLSTSYVPRRKIVDIYRGQALPEPVKDSVVHEDDFVTHMYTFYTLGKILE